MRPQCPSCDSFNEPEALHCNQCGRPMTAGGTPTARRQGRWGWLPWTLPLGVAAGLWFPALRETDDPAKPVSNPAGPELQKKTEPNRFQSPESDPDPALFETDPTQEVLGVNAGDRARWGWLEVSDPVGISLGVIAGAVSSEGWVALPRTPLLGASEVSFRRGRSGAGQVREIGRAHV